jgi:hypothetical protein
VQWNDTAGSFDDVVALRDVTHMVECDPALEVEKTCAAAWIEWRRDVLMIPPPTPAPAAAGAAPGTESDSSCSLAALREPRKSSNGSALIALATLLLGVLRREAKSIRRVRRR